MPKQKATFQPTVRPDWAGAMDYMSESEQSKIFQAILMFPSIDLPESAYWNKTIKPDLQNQYETFMSVCEKKAIGIRKRWENARSIDKYSDVIDMNTTLQEKNSNEQDMLYIVKDKDKNKDKENNGGVGEKKEKINEDTHFYAGGQMWAFPFEFRALAKKYWTDETIREIEKSFSCQEKDSEVSIRMLLDSYPENKSEELRKNMSIKTYGENNKVRLTDEQYTKLQELYGRRLENAIQILDGYLAENKTREKKYTNHYAVMRRNNWVYNKTFDGDFVPLKPQVADMSKFVRAKPLGEEND